MTYRKTVFCLIAFVGLALSEGSGWARILIPGPRYHQQEPLEQFADRLIATPDKERRSLIDANRQLVVPELVRVLLTRGDQARGLRKFAESLSIYSIAQILAEKLSNELLIARAIAEQGFTNVAADNAAEALKLLETAYPHAKIAQDLKLLSRIDAGRCEAYLNQGDLVAALDAAKSAVKEEPPDDAITRGDAHIMLGRARAALALYQEAFPEFEKAANEYGNSEKALVVLNEEAILYSDAGEREEAVRVYDRLLDRLGSATEDNRYRRLKVLINKGLDQALSDHADEGLKTIRAAIPLFRKTDADVVFISANLNRAVAAKVAKNQDEAREAIKVAYDYANASTQTEAKRPLNFIRIEWSRILLDNKDATSQDIQQATKLATEALTNTDPTDLEGKWAAYVAMGDAHLIAKRSKEALESLTQATQLIDQIVKHLGDDPEAIAAYLSDKVDIFEAVARLLSEAGRPEAALVALENARARGLLNVLERGAPPLRQAMSATDREREAIAKEKLAQANREMADAMQDPKLTETRKHEFAGKLQRARVEWASLRLLLSRTYPGIYRSNQVIESLTEPELARLVPEDTAVLEYILNDIDAIGFVIVRSAVGNLEIHSFELGADASTLKQRIENYQALVSNEQGIYETAGKQLYKDLVGKAEPLLLNKRRVIVVPTGQLWQVPFQALVLSNGQFFVEKYAVSYVASLSILRHLRMNPPFSRAAARRLVTFANPSVQANPAGASNSAINRRNTLLMDEPLAPLIKIEVQAKRLGRQLGRKHFVYSGPRATEVRFRRAAENATAIYLAAHGVVNNDAPLFSRVVLVATGNNTDTDGVVEAWEVLGMKTHALLVVLAACDTAGGKIKVGEGVIGLSWAFSVAGCPRLVASQWSVPEDSTALLIDSMMRGVFGIDKTGRNSRKAIAPDLALQVAAKELIGNNVTRHPFHWAAFDVIGDSR